MEKAKKTVTISIEEYLEIKEMAEKFKDADVLILPIHGQYGGYAVLDSIKIALNDKSLPKAMPFKDLLSVLINCIKNQSLEVDKIIQEKSDLKEDIRLIQKMSWFDFKVYKHNKKFK